MNSLQQKDVSSAEITAIYRSAIPELSGDTLSEKLVSTAGSERAAEFIEKYNYPLVNRKISVRAGYFLSEATRLLASGHYDSCISLASGFSLLTYYIADKNINHSHVKYFDTDLPHMIAERAKRIENIKSLLNPEVVKKIQLDALDVEQAYQQHKKLKDIFPNCHHPIFIVEGLSYFLSPGCLDWLIKEMGSYTQSAVIIDYWPDNMLQTSSLFARVFEDLNQGMILESLKSFWDERTMIKLRSFFPKIEDWMLADLDSALSASKNLTPELLDLNDYFPLKMLTAEKGIETAGEFLPY